MNNSRGLIILSDKENLFYSGSDYTFLTEVEPYGYSIFVDTDVVGDFEEMLKRKSASYLQAIEEAIFFCKTNEGPLVDVLFSRITEAIRIHEEMSFLKEAEYVTFDMSYVKMEKYVANNPRVFDKKILVTCEEDFSNEDLRTLERVFGGKTDNVYFSMRGNDSLISFEECKKTQEYISRTVGEIESLHLSPLEKVMYVYDIVRDRIYKEESSDEELSESRDLTRVLLGDKIVCEGYARLMCTLLSKLEISNMKYRLICNDVEGIGHSRVVVYIDDEKYDIQGVYYLDPTADHRTDETRDFLYRYRFFVKTKHEIEHLSNGSFTDITFGDFGENYVIEFAKMCREKGLAHIDKRVIEEINRISFLIDGKSIIPNPQLLDENLPDVLRRTFDLDETIKNLNRYVELFNKQLSCEKFMRLLVGVRKLQYYHEPDKYPFSMTAIFNVLQNSTWHLPSEQRAYLFEKLFGEKISFDKKTAYLKFMNDENLDREVVGVILTHVLDQILDQKREDGKKM